MKLFGDVRFDRVKPQSGRGDTGEREHVLGNHDLGLPQDGIAKCDIYAESCP